MFIPFIRRRPPTATAMNNFAENDKAKQLSYGSSKGRENSGPSFSTKANFKDPGNSICCELSDVECIAEYSHSLEDWNEL
jgi:hypothetical protein